MIGPSMTKGVGTMTHFSPEQIGEDPISTATDIWALGVTIYELCCGIKPFECKG